MRRAWGWSPAVTSSPLISTRLRTPRAAAPSKSAWSASRFRSRTVSCMIGSRPFSTRRCAAASDDMWTCAPVLSVQLTASTDPRSTSAKRQVASGSALLVDVSSAVTTKRPSRSSPASRLGAGMRLPTLRGDAVSTTDEVDPRGGPLQLPIDGLLQVLDVVLEDGQAARALPGFDPDAALVGIDLAVAVGAHTTARTVAQILGAAHRAAEAGRVQDALTAHAAVPDRFLERLLDSDHEALDDAHRASPCAASCRSARPPESVLRSQRPAPRPRSAWPSWWRRRRRGRSGRRRRASRIPR